MGAGLFIYDPVIMNAQFRSAEPADVDVLVEMIREYYALAGYAINESRTRHALSHLIATPALGKIWVIEVAGEAAGYLVLTLGYSLEYGGYDAFVDELYLREAFRGRGLGRQALDIAEAACKELSVNALHLEVEKENVSAQYLYRSWGFTDHDRYLMTKKLGPS